MSAQYSPDEFLALVLAIGVTLISWLRWYYLLSVTGAQVRRRGKRWLLAVVPLIGLVLVAVVLFRWSSEDVRTDGAYIFFYLIIAAGWLGLFRLFLPCFGLHPRDEVLERGNDAAAWAVAGALVGASCCFAGGNVGNGPGWWVVLFSAGLSTVSLYLLWWLVHCISDLPEKVTVERDLGAGLRAAGFFVASGLILGRAVAGDWISASATLSDFGRMAWPALLLAAVVSVMERCCPLRVNLDSGGFSSGWLPASIYIAAATVILFAW